MMNNKTAWMPLVVFVLMLSACQLSPPLDKIEIVKKPLISQHYQIGPRHPELQWSLDWDDWPQGIEKKYFRFKEQTKTYETNLFRLSYFLQPRQFVSSPKGHVYGLSHQGVLHCFDSHGNVRWSKGVSKSSLFSGAYTLRTTFLLPSFRGTNFQGIYFHWSNVWINIKLPSYFFPFIPCFSGAGNMHIFDNGTLVIQEQSHIIAYDENGRRLWSRKMKGLQHSNQEASLALLVENKHNESIVTAVNSMGKIAWRKSFEMKHIGYTISFNQISSRSGVQPNIDIQISEGNYQYVVYFKDYWGNVDTNSDKEEEVAIFSRFVFTEKGDLVNHKEILKFDDAFLFNHRPRPSVQTENNIIYSSVALNQDYNYNGILFSESEFFWCYQLNQVGSPKTVYRKINWDNQLLWNHEENSSYKLPIKCPEKEINLFLNFQNALSLDDIHSILDEEYLGIFYHQDNHPHESQTIATLIDAQGQIKWEIILSNDESYVFVETDETGNIYLGISDHINQTSKALAVNADGHIIWEKNLTENGEITIFYLTQSGLLLFSTTESPSIIYALGD